jgi:hypothetical protein
VFAAHIQNYYFVIVLTFDPPAIMRARIRIASPVLVERR